MNFESLLHYLPSRFSPETSLRGVFLACTLALAGIAWLGVAHSQKRLTDLRLAITEQGELLNQRDPLQLQAATIELQVAAAKADCELMIAKLPTGPAESEFLTLLSNSAAQFDVTLGDYRPGGVQNKPMASQIELRLRATGSYTGLCRWLDHMSQLPRLVHIEHMTLSGPASPGGDCSLDLQLTIMFGFVDEIQ